MKQPHFCPVCQIEMKLTASEGLVGCPTRRSVIYPGMTEGVSYWDAGILFGPNNIKYWQMYEIPPYRIIIHDRHALSGTKTTIKKIVVNPYGQGQGSWEYMKILTMDVAIELPWDNPEQVIEKIKLYTTFS
jgi:hypothetical protein